MILSKLTDDTVARITSNAESDATNVKFPCGICNNSVKHNDKSILCDQCKCWIHIKCNDISVAEYKDLQKEPIGNKWICLYCSVLTTLLYFLSL